MRNGGRFQKDQELYWEPLVDIWANFGFQGIKLSELLKQAAKKPKKEVCEQCGKTKAVKKFEATGENLCMYCRGKATKEIKEKEDGKEGISDTEKS
jgi:hypothetical protein